VDIPDKSTKFFPYATHGPSFHFLVGASVANNQTVAILDFKDGRQAKIYNC
jgi:hypothetical protein